MIPINSALQRWVRYKHNKTWYRSFEFKIKYVIAIWYMNWCQVKIPQSFADCQHVKTLKVRFRQRDLEISIPIYLQSFIEIEIEMIIEFLNQNLQLKFEIDSQFSDCKGFNTLTVSIWLIIFLIFIPIICSV